MWVLAVLLLGVQGYTDPYINGKWAVQGLGQLNATFMTHVCVEIKGNKATESWYMRSKIPENEQKALKTDAVEVKYQIESDLVFNSTAPTPWVYSSELSPGQGESTGSVQFTATAVSDVSVSPSKFKAAMTEERQKFVGRSRYCLYQYKGMPAELSLMLGCSSSEPADGFYRYGETEEYPDAMGRHAVLSRGHTCEASSVAPIWPVMNAGYRIELALAAGIAEMPHASYKIVLAELAKKLNLDAERLELSQVVQGSVVIRSFYPSIEDTSFEARMDGLQYNKAAGQALGGYPVIALSYQWRPAASITISKTDEDERLHTVPIGLMIGVWILGLGLFALSLWLLLSK